MVDGLDELLPPTEPTLSFTGPPRSASQISEYKAFMIQKYKYEAYLEEMRRRRKQSILPDDLGDPPDASPPPPIPARRDVPSPSTPTSHVDQTSSSAAAEDPLPSPRPVSSDDGESFSPRGVAVVGRNSSLSFSGSGKPHPPSLRSSMERTFSVDYIPSHSSRERQAWDTATPPLPNQGSLSSICRSTSLRTVSTSPIAVKISTNQKQSIPTLPSRLDVPTKMRIRKRGLSLLVEQHPHLKSSLEAAGHNPRQFASIIGSVPWERLPHPVIFNHVFPRLSIKDLCSLEAVSVQARALVSQDVVWRAQAMRLGHAGTKSAPWATWKEAVRNKVMRRTFGPGDSVLKVLLVGPKGVGKSQLANRFVNGEFDSKHSPTIGVEVLRKEVSCDERNVAVQVWDCAGDERFRRMVDMQRSNYRNTAVALFVYDRSELSSVEELLEKFVVPFDSITGTAVPHMLVGTKSDLVDWKNPVQVQRFASKSVGWWTHATVCSRDGHGVDALFEEVTRQGLAWMEDANAIRAAALAATAGAQEKGQKHSQASEAASSTTTGEDKACIIS